MLTEPDDLLDTGIEVEAKPSGKNVKKLSLLSGGERSLTALAFLFAVFRSRPSPFYVMDEVEAALDDVNLHRFLGLVAEFRREAQLLIVSHQKRTMEAGDSLLGVTMQPGGRRKVIVERVTAGALTLRPSRDAARRRRGLGSTTGSVGRRWSGSTSSSSGSSCCSASACSSSAAGGRGAALRCAAATPPTDARRRRPPRHRRRPRRRVLEPRGPRARVVEPEVVAPPATLRERMARARSALAGAFTGVRGRRGITDETWDDLEEALLLADVGIGVTDRPARRPAGAGQGQGDHRARASCSTPCAAT